MFKKTFKKGFSLIELLVVITIIAILSVVAYTAVGGQTIKAKNSRRMQDLSTIQTALEIFFIEKGEYPSELDDGTAGSDDDLVPKYMPKMALDPWGVPYAYAKSGKQYQLAATIESEDENPNTAYIIGNYTGLDSLVDDPPYTKLSN